MHNSLAPSCLKPFQQWVMFVCPWTLAVVTAVYWPRLVLLAAAFSLVCFNISQVITYNLSWYDVVQLYTSPHNMEWIESKTQILPEANDDNIKREAVNEGAWYHKSAEWKQTGAHAGRCNNRHLDSTAKQWWEQLIGCASQRLENVLVANCSAFPRPRPHLTPSWSTGNRKHTNSLIKYGGNFSDQRNTRPLCFPISRHPVSHDWQLTPLLWSHEYYIIYILYYSTMHLRS